MTTCGDVLDLLDDYLDGELRPATMRLVHTHLAGCNACTAEFERARREVAAVRERLRQVVVPPHLKARLSAALRELSSHGPH